MPKFMPDVVERIRMFQMKRDYKAFSRALWGALAITVKGVRDWIPDMAKNFEVIQKFLGCLGDAWGLSFEKDKVGVG